MNIKKLSTIVALLVVPVFLQAQPKAAPEDVSTIDGIIKAYYEVVSGPAGEKADMQRDFSLHHPNAWIAIAGLDQQGNRVINTMTLAEYHGDNAPRQEGFWEWETDRTIKKSGNMIHVWSSYEGAKTENGEPFMSGVNSITLFYDGERYWIMNWMFDASVH